ncbi:MAG: hypothetical protein U1D55_02765 [Phycisphaerae bacterium]
MPGDLVREYLDSTAHVQNLALRTRERYRAALTRFSEFCGERSVSTIDRFDVLEVERFVAWLRTCRRNRNGRPGGRRGAYKVGGIEFILSTCRTAFNRMLPAFTTRLAGISTLPWNSARGGPSSMITGRRPSVAARRVPLHSSRTASSAQRLDSCAAPRNATASPACSAPAGMLMFAPLSASVTGG